MTDPNKENSAETQSTNKDADGEAQHSTTPSSPAAPTKPKVNTVPSFEELAEGKPTKSAAPKPKPAKPAPTSATASPAAPKPAAPKPAAPKPAAPKPAAPKPAAPKPAAQKPAAQKPAATKPEALDPSISIDNDSPSIPALIVDAVAAAAAIAFTVLLLQDVLPFLK